MAGYDLDTEKRLANLQHKLFENGFHGEQTKDIPLHITLGTYDITKEKEIADLVKAVAHKTKPFSITFSHVGIFGGSKVLFIAPDTNRELLDLKENFGESYNWTPHTTMLIDKPEIIYSGIPIIANEFEAFEGQVESIYLYEFWPTRFILCEKFIIH
jgi:2'-5' RNA ligase